jgi:hypothetical protein
MLNRPSSSPNPALDARRTISAEMREWLRAIPPTPFDWASFDPLLALRDGGASPDMRLAALARLLCAAPARSAELRALWNECLITGAMALRLAPHLNGDPETSAIAGLLHRLGDILTIRAIAITEHSARVRLDAASKADLCAEHGGEQLERAVRAWGVPPRAAATAAEWRRLREFPGAAAEATAVYIGRLLAIELISPQFCAPGVVDRAAAEVGLPADALSAVRADANLAKLLASHQ